MRRMTMRKRDKLYQVSLVFYALMFAAILNTWLKDTGILVLTSTILGVLSTEVTSQGVELFSNSNKSEEEDD